MFVFLELPSIFREDYFLLYPQNLAGKGREKMGMMSHFQGKGQCVSHVGQLLPPLKSAKERAMEERVLHHRLEMFFVTSSVPKQEHRTAVDPAQRHT